MGVALALTSATGELCAKAFTSAEFGFSADFPARISEKKLQDDKFTQTKFMAETSSAAYSVSILTPRTGHFEDDESRIRALDSFMLSLAGDERFASKIQVYTAGELVGREGQYSAANLVAHTRAFLVGDRIYSIAYLGFAGTENSVEALNFLNSFLLLRQ